MKRNIEYTDRQYICCGGWDKNYCCEVLQAMSTCLGEGKLGKVGEDGEVMRSRILCSRGSKLNILDGFCIWNAALREGCVRSMRCHVGSRRS